VLINVCLAQVYELEVNIVMARLGKLDAEHLDFVRGATKVRRDSNLPACLTCMCI
jgi:hypothetical protein